MMAAFAAGYLYLEASSFNQIENSDRERNARSGEISLLTQSLFLMEQSFDAAHNLLFFSVLLKNGEIPRTKVESYINVELLSAEQARDALQRFLRGKGSHIPADIRRNIASAAAEHQTVAAKVQNLLRGGSRQSADAMSLFDARSSLRQRHDELMNRINAEMGRLKINYDLYAKSDIQAQTEARNKAVAGVLIVEALTLFLGLMELAAAGRAGMVAQALDEEREKYKKLLGHAGDAVIISDADTGLVAEINRKGEELLRMRHTDVVGKPLESLFPPAERTQYMTLFAEMTARGGPDETGPSPKRIKLIRADGLEVPVDVRLALITVEGHRLMQGIYRDIAAQRAHEKLMEQQAAAQMELVRQTVEALEEARDERKKAEEANRLKSEFVANMSHELRTPLTSVLGYSRIARERIDDVLNTLKLIRQYAAAEEGKSPVAPVSALAEMAETANHAEQTITEIASFGDVVVGQGERLLQLINDLLDMSSLESGQLTMQEHVSSARMILHSVITRLTAAAGEKHIRLTTNSDNLRNSDIFFLGDTSRIEQTIFNLAQNAIKYSTGGEVSITAATENGHLFFRIKDQGIGIPAKHYETIFDAFRQLDGGNTRAQGGVGLGLTLSRKLAEAMKGSISVNSVEGKGSEFTFMLPYRPVES